MTVVLDADGIRRAVTRIAHEIVERNHGVADVVLVGELRDRETADAALHLAESGMLVFATLPTTDSMHTVERLVTMFPPERQKQAQLRVAAVLKAAVSQVLTCPSARQKVWAQPQSQV